MSRELDVRIAVDPQLDRLAVAHMGELGFAEIGDHIQWRAAAPPPSIAFLPPRTDRRAANAHPLFHQPARSDRRVRQI